MDIVNIVVSKKFNFKFNLEKIENAYPKICYRPKNFPSINLKLHESDLCQIFSNGNIIVLGEKTMNATMDLFKAYLVLLYDLGYPCTIENIKIQNIIARYSYGEKINLGELAKRTKFEFEPELFPAVRYRLEDLKITINIFRTGKCMILGGKSMEYIYLAEIFLTSLLNGESNR